jgi:hypothetical protein
MTAVESARRRNGEVVGEPALAHDVSVRVARRGAVHGSGVEKGGASAATGREEETGCRWISVGFVDFFFELKHVWVPVLRSLIPARRRKIMNEAKEPLPLLPTFFLLYREEVDLYIISTD